MRRGRDELQARFCVLKKTRWGMLNALSKYVCSRSEVKFIGKYFFNEVNFAAERTTVFKY